MTAPQRFVIVGAGLAGAKAAETLRDEGFTGSVRLIGTESEPPYERPPLSKQYLAGTAERDTIFVHGPDWYDEHDVELSLGTAAVDLDVEAHELTLSTGEKVGYDELLLATGSRARRIRIPGADLAGVRELRTVADADRLRQDLSDGGRRVVIVGAGWIGLETAAAARGFGNEVTVIEPQPVPLRAALGDELGSVFAALHREHGVDLRLATGAQRFAGSGGQVTGVGTDQGDTVPADVVVVGIGAQPRVELAERAGLAVADGVVVDAALRSSHPDVFAAGDIARAHHPLVDRGVRVEHWATALHSGPVAARSMLGLPAVYDKTPYFYTDQYDLGMEYVGFAPTGPADVVYRGDPAGGEFIAFWVESGRVVAGMNVNVWDVSESIDGLVRSGEPVDTRRLTDPDVPLEEVLHSRVVG